MDRFRLAHATGEDWQAAAGACAGELGRIEVPPGRRPLGFVYVTDLWAQHLHAIADALKAATGVADWVGTTGIGACATGAEYFAVPALVALVGDFPAGGVRLLAGDGAAAGAVFGVVHGDPRRREVLQALADTAERSGAFLVGALASSRGGYAHVAGGPVDAALSGALFGEEVAVATALTQGCSPLGPAHQVTAADDETVLALDGEPALKVLAADLQAAGITEASRLAGGLFAAFPIAGSDMGDYLVRNLVDIDPSNGGITVAHRPLVGDTLAFCRRDAEAARADLARMLVRLKARAAAPRGGVYFSCVARGPNLFGPRAQEMNAIRDALGDVPLAGFFANGEISAGRLYTHTGVLALFL